MKAFGRFLFPMRNEDRFNSNIILLARILFGVLLMSHGVEKWSHFSEMSSHFPNPLGLGSEFSLVLVIFAEVFCSAAVIVGLFYRLALIPILIDMFVIDFIFMNASPFHVKELTFVYLIVFVLMFAVGPGKYSLDYRLFVKQRMVTSTEKS